MNVLKSSDVVSTSNSTVLSTSHAPSTQSTVTLLHPSQVPLLYKLNGSNENKTLQGMAQVILSWWQPICGWNSHSKLANLATRLQGQAYASTKLAQHSNNPHMTV